MVDDLAITADGRGDAAIAIQATMSYKDGLNLCFELTVPIRDRQCFCLIVKRATWQLRSMQQVGQGKRMP